MTTTQAEPVNPSSRSSDRLRGVATIQPKPLVLRYPCQRENEGFSCVTVDLFRPVLVHSMFNMVSESCQEAGLNRQHKVP